MNWADELKANGVRFRPSEDAQPEPPAKGNTLWAIDLFAGCGGVSLGLTQAGFRVVGGVEVDELACETYLMNHPRVAVWPRAIERVYAADLMRVLRFREGHLDLLAGCPPCQGFSSLTTLNGTPADSDARNDLVFEFLRFAKVLLPKVVMMENVPALAGNWRLRVMRSELENLGYRLRVEILDAADYGVPQRRRRLIVLGARDGDIPLANPVTDRPTVRTALDGLPPHGLSGDALHDFPELRSASVMERIRRVPPDGGSRAQAGTDVALACHTRCSGFKDVYGRMAWNAVAPTITSGCFNPSKGRFLHPEEDRAITLREASLLQSFPRDYQFSLRRGKAGVARLIGNALPPEFVRQHAINIRDYLVDARGDQ